MLKMSVTPCDLSYAINQGATVYDAFASVDVIDPDKLRVNLFKGSDFTGGRSFHFYLRDTMHKRGLCRHVVLVSICPTPVLCLNG